MPNPYGQIIRSVDQYGFSISELWCLLFEWNEYWWDCNPDFVLTDLEIATKMREAFPERTSWSKNSTHVQRARAAFNRGAYTYGDLPQKRSHRYDRRGTKLSRHTPKVRRHRWPTKDVNPRTTPVKVEPLPEFVTK